MARAHGPGMSDRSLWPGDRPGCRDFGSYCSPISAGRQPCNPTPRTPVIVATGAKARGGRAFRARGQGLDQRALKRPTINADCRETCGRSKPMGRGLTSLLPLDCAWTMGQQSPSITPTGPPRPHPTTPENAPFTITDALARRCPPSGRRRRAHRRRGKPGRVHAGSRRALRCPPGSQDLSANPCLRCSFQAQKQAVAGPGCCLCQPSVGADGCLGPVIVLRRRRRLGGPCQRPAAPA